MGNPAEAIIAAVEEHLGTWRPSQGIELYEMLTALPGVFEALHGAIQGVMDGIGEEQDLPGWLTAASGELLKAVTAAAGQAAHVDEEFQRAYGFYIADRARKRPGRRRR